MNLKNENAETSISLSEIADLLNARKRFIFAAATIVALLAIFYHFMRPSYTAQTTMLVQRAENSPLQAMMGAMTGTNIVTGKTNEYQDKYLSLLDSHEFRVFAARKMLADPSYDADRKALTHRGLLGRLIRGILYVQISDPMAKDTEVEDLARALKVVQFLKKGFDEIAVTVKMGDFAMAVRLSNFAAERALELVYENEVAELASAKQFVESQLSQSSNRLKDIDNSIVDFRKRSKYITTDDVPDQIVERIDTLKRDQETNRLKFELNQKLIAALEKELQQDSEQILTSGARNLQSSDVVNELFRKIQDLRYKRILFLAQGEAPDSQNVRSLDRTIDTVANQIRVEMKRSGGTEEDVKSLLQDKDGLINKIHKLKRENQYLSTQQETLTKALTEANAPLESLPQAVQTLVGFNRNTQTEYAMFKEMRSKILQMEVEQVSLKNKIRILEKATVAGISPRLNFLPKAIFAFLLTCLLGAIAAYSVESLDTTVKGRVDLLDLGLIHIGSVPEVSHSWHSYLTSDFSRWIRARAGKKNSEINSVETWKHHPDAPEVMAFNHIRARVLKMRTASGQSSKIISVMSSKPGEGKSFIACNLALALCQTEKKVLLIDCDLRKSTLPEKLGIASEQAKEGGLTGMLAGGLSLEKSLISDIVPGLDVLTAGKSVKKPTELISGPKFSALLEAMRSLYDYVILDTPPVLPVVDSLVVANLSDSVILVSGYRRTQLSSIQASVEKLHSMDHQTIFAVLNNDPKVHEYIYISSSSKTSSRAPQAPISNGSPKTAEPAHASFNVQSEIARFKETLPKEQV